MIGHDKCERHFRVLKVFVLKIVFHKFFINLDFFTFHFFNLKIAVKVGNYIIAKVLVNMREK